jgi:hypothetical protein
MTPLGFRVKDFFNRHRRLALLPAGILTLFDVYFNDRLRLFYRRREYPIVRAWAALILLNIYERERDPVLIECARAHLEWLTQHSCQGYSGPCWGLGFNYAVNSEITYDHNMPLTTMTPYPLEAFVRYTKLSGDDRYLSTIRGIYEFLEKDVEVMEETATYLVTSYGAVRDRKVINAVSYVMLSYALLLPYIEAEERQRTEVKIGKLYAYVAMNQKEDGSWLYSPDERSFIDCFHSCIVLKNLIKTDSLVALAGSRELVERGYGFLKNNFVIRREGLFKRFVLANKTSLVAFDLYDNSEMLNLAFMMGDSELVSSLDQRIEEAFVRGNNIYSQIDFIGLRHGRNTLRWAVMPYFYALSVTGRLS